MKLISWNVNGLRACLTHGFAESFAALDADIFSVQETKMQPGQADFAPEGYTEYTYSAEKTFLAAQDTNISRAVTKQRECLFRDTCKYKLTFFSIRKNLPRLWIDYFCNKMIFIDMHTGLFAALKGNTRSHDF